MNVDKDAFSSGQIGSKIWLCEELEKLNWTSNLTYIYGGWHGLTGFLLLSRGKFQVDKIRSLDIDPSCEAIADMINENWVYQDWQFKSHTADCSILKPTLGNPDLIINTSTEHFDTLEWWNNIPKGTYVALQGNNMPHDDHVIHSTSLDDFCNLYPLDSVLYKGELEFSYPDWSFTRFMLIGKT
jgi:hypothetical protein